MASTTLQTPSTKTTTFLTPQTARQSRGTGSGPPGGGGGGGGGPGGGGNIPPPPPQGPNNPRVGGVHHATAWTGGSNIPAQAPTAPNDVLCYRPTDFRSMQHQHEALKMGLEENKRLELESSTGTGSEPSIPFTSWMEEMRLMVNMRGFDTVFRVYDAASQTEVFLLTNWGEVNMNQVHTWVQTLQNAIGDEYDKENLRLSALAVRDSLGPELLRRVTSLANADTTGPEYLMLAINQVSFLNASMVRNLSNQIGALKLKDIPGENVATLTEKISALARQIVGSGQEPNDLKNLIAKAYTTGTVVMFQNHALTVNSRVMTGTHAATWEQMVTQHNQVYQDLVQGGDYPPAQGNTKDQDDKIHGMFAEVERKLDKLTIANNNANNNNGSNNDGNGKNNRNNGPRKCFNCGSTEHLARNCPEKGNKNDGKEKNWRTVPPNTSKGDKNEKVVDGVTYKWCGRCRKNKGFWNGGDKAHFTSDHKSKSDLQNDQQDNNGGNAPVARLGYVPGPMAIGFLASTEPLVKDCGGQQQ